YTQKRGKLELASGGTLILDEIGDMPLSLQSKLLRAIQEQEFYRLGGSVPIKVNLRIISLTNKNLFKLIKGNQFRDDLYYRIVHRSFKIPPLGERKEDITELINYYTEKFIKVENKYIGGYSVKAYEALMKYNWPGNIRQLENEINSIVFLLDEGEMVNFKMLSEEIQEFYINEAPSELKITSEEKIYKSNSHNKPQKKDIIELLKRNNWNKSRTAKELNMTYQGLHKKMKKMAIVNPEQ
ncbi:Nif-specific regulatory protein, partial [Candidatus Methanomarinus sp.]